MEYTRKYPADSDVDTVAAANPLDDDSHGNSLSVPWHLRQVTSSNAIPAFRFLGNKHFWDKIDFALRVSIVALLPCQVLIYNTSGVFVSTTILGTGAMIAARQTVGDSVAFIFSFLKSIFFWVPLATISHALELWMFPSAWASYFFVVTFLFGVFLDASRRMSLLLFTISMVSQFNPKVRESYGLQFPVRLCAEFLLGSLFGLGATFIPFQRRASVEADAKLKVIAKNISTCFSGLCDSFWGESNPQRNVKLVKIRFGRRAMEMQFTELNSFLVFSKLEPEPAEKGSFRDRRRDMFQKLAASLDSMQRGVNAVAESPGILSEKGKQFGIRLATPLQDVAACVDKVLLLLGAATCEADLVHVPLRDLALRAKSLEDVLLRARRELVYESEYSISEDRATNPVMHYYLFNAFHFVRTLEGIQESGDIEAEPLWKTVVVDPCMESVAMLGRFLTCSPTVADDRSVKEAFKTSLAMLLAIGFFTLVDETRALVSGPTIIAFVSSMNPGEAVSAAQQRLFGTLFGAVIGFFAASFRTSSVIRVLSLCIIVFVTSFFRTNVRNGPAAFYSSFVVIGMLQPGVTVDDAVSRIQQNTFAIIIYVVVSVMLFPAHPLEELVTHRTKTIDTIAEAFALLMKFFQKPEDNAAHLKKVSAAMAVVQAMLTKEAALMPLAEMEPTLRKLPFPAHSSQQLHRVSMKMFAGMEMMLAGWSRIVTVKENSPLFNMLKAMEPLASDIAVCCRTIMNMLTVSLLNPYSGLGVEMIAKSTELSDLANKFQNMEIALFHAIVDRATMGTPLTSFREPSIPEVNEPYPQSERTLPQTNTLRKILVQLPLTTEEAESTHAIVFTVVIFSGQVREMLMNVEDLQQSELAEDNS